MKGRGIGRFGFDQISITRQAAADGQLAIELEIPPASTRERCIRITQKRRPALVVAHPDVFRPRHEHKWLQYHDQFGLN